MVAALSLFACAPKNQQSNLNTQSAQFILGGTNADSAYQNKNGVVGIVLFMKKTGLGGQSSVAEATCTGSLIDKRMVLTAAHCLAAPGIVDIVVIFSPRMDEAVTQKRYVHAVAIDFNENFGPADGDHSAFTDGKPWNDVGLIKLEGDAPSEISLAQLPTEDDFNALKPGVGLTFAGYGVTTPIVNEVKVIGGHKQVTPVGGPDTANVLRYVDNIKIIKVTGDKKEIELDQEHGARGACHGDSGGPAYLKKTDGSMVVVGITSRGTNLIGNCDEQNVYTSVFGQLDWIKTHSAALAAEKETSDKPAVGNQAQH